MGKITQQEVLSGFNLLTDAEKAIVLGKIANIVEDTTPEFGGEVDAGEHTIGFSLKSWGTVSSGTVNIDLRTSNKHIIVIDGAVTVTFTNPTNACNITIVVEQTAAVGRSLTLPTIKWIGKTNSGITAEDNAIDLVTLLWTGSYYVGTIGSNCGEEE